MRPLSVLVFCGEDLSLLPAFIDSLVSVADELAGLDCDVFLIASGASQEPSLEQIRGRLSRLWMCEVVQASTTLSLNVQFSPIRNAVERRRDVLLLDSGTLLYPNAISQILHVAKCDPMIGFVSPRSNDSMICSLPHQQEFLRRPANEANQLAVLLSPYLPEWQFVPAGTRFCLFIKFEMLQEFGASCLAPTTEFHLMLSANRCGFRTALANRAFVYHGVEQSQPHPEADLKALYPEYFESLSKYIDGPVYEAECLLSSLIPDGQGRVDLVFDFSSFGKWHNGTTESAKQILRRAAKSWTSSFKLYVMASPEATRVHQLDQVAGVSVLPLNTCKRFAIAFRFGQPFEPEHWIRMARIAPIQAWGMLDPIATDCMYLNRSDLDLLWSAVFLHSDGVFYISDFVAEAFRRRYRLRPGLAELVSYLSLNYKDYRFSRTPQPARSLLVVGNAFDHKRVPHTVEALSLAFPEREIIALGVRDGSWPNVSSYPSGDLTDEHIDDLWNVASVVIFPSLYEGFGLPVMKALANGKPILARSIPVTRALKEKLNAGSNLILYSSTEELVRFLRGDISFLPENAAGNPAWGWDQVTEALLAFIDDLRQSFSFSDVLLPRLSYRRLIEKSLAATVTPPDKEQVFHEVEVKLQARHDARVRELEKMVQTLDTAVRDREACLQDIRASLSWRLTFPVRAIARKILLICRKVSGS